MRFDLKTLLLRVSHLREKLINLHISILFFVSFSNFILKCPMCRLRHIISQANGSETNCRWGRCWIWFVSMASIHSYRIVQVNYLVTKSIKKSTNYAFGYRCIHKTSTFLYTHHTSHHSDMFTSSKILIYNHSHSYTLHNTSNHVPLSPWFPWFRKLSNHTHPKTRTSNFKSLPDRIHFYHIYIY